MKETDATVLFPGGITPSSPTKKEIEEGEWLNLPRLIMKFNYCDYGRLCAMIRVINEDRP